MKLFKKTFRIYVILTILGMICIGLGCGIAIFEMSNYQVADYHTSQPDPNLPQLKTSTIKLEAKLDSPNEPFFLDATDWYFDGGYDIQYDNNLKDKVLIDVTAPEELYLVTLEKVDSNYYYLHCKPDEFQMIRSTLALAKEGYIPENYPLAKVTLTMSEAQAKNFELNHLRNEREALEQNHQEEIYAVQNDYQQQISDLHEDHQQQMNDLNQQHSEQIQDLQEEHQNQIESLQQEHQDQLEQKDEQIENLQNQLNEARSALQ